MVIKILITGGTFDKEYDEITGNLYFKDTHIKEIIDLGRSKVKVKIEKVMLIDSLEMKNSHRELILKKCLESNENKIIITHGTDTMTKTGEFIAQGNLKKTIVLTGAMIPYKFGSSDGLFNLGGAIAYVQSLEEGVYISMNGKCFKWHEVQKNIKTGVFEYKI